MAAFSCAEGFFVEFIVVDVVAVLGDLAEGVLGLDGALMVIVVGVD